MKKLLLLLSVLIFKLSFSQNERVYIKGTTQTTYGQTVELKELLKEDKVFYAMEMDMKEFLTPQQVQSMQELMQKDAAGSFILQDKLSNKITFFTRKRAIRNMELLDYCKRILALAQCSTVYNSYSENVLEFVID